MKIIHLISGGDVGGAKTHVHSLLAGLKETDGILLVCFMNGPFAEEAKALGIPTQVMTERTHKVVRLLAEQIRREGFQIIHCHGSRANLIGSLLKKRLHLPTISTVHSDPHLDYLGRPFARATYGVINAVALRKMDYHVAVSDSMRQLLIGRGFDPNRIFTIYNGVEFSGRSEPQGDRRAFLRSIGWEVPEDAVVVGIAARLHPVKDIPTLLRGFAEAYGTQKQLRLLIAGDGPDRDALEALAKELGIAEVTCFAGWITDMRSFYRSLDVNTLTSRSETFPYAITEGAREHLPTVASRVGGIPAIIRPGETGFLFEPGDHKALGRHLAALAASQELRKKLGDALYNKANEEFSAEATRRTQQEIYRRILRREERTADGKRCGILICGAYGKGNSGDDAILKSMVALLRQTDPDIPICATSRSPRLTAQDVQIRCVYTFAYRKLRKQMKQCSLYLSGGGSLIQDSTSTRSLWYYLNSIRTAKRLGNKVMMFSCGIGPVKWKANRKRASRIIERYVDRITLRDRISETELRNLPVTGVETTVTADMALLVPPASEQEVLSFCAEAGLDPEARWLVFALRPWNGIRQHYRDFARAAAYGAEHYGLTPVFLAMEPRKDHAVCAEVAALTDSVISCHVIDAPEDANLAVALIRRADCVLGMRLHSLIFAAANETPFSGISYDPKINGFMDYVKQGSYCDISEVRAETLCSMIDGMQRNRADFARTAQELLELARENCRIAFELIE